VRLSEPISASAAIEAVGSLPNGDMETPTQNAWTDTGWYSAGPQPGQQGSAVIDGHLDRPGGAPAVFWSLRNLQSGDSIVVVMSSGKMLHFRVTHLAFYAPTDAPLQEIFGDRSGVYLNLITCAGDWIPSQQQTTLRLGVYAALDGGLGNDCQGDPRDRPGLSIHPGEGRDAMNRVLHRRRKPDTDAMNRVLHRRTKPDTDAMNRVPTAHPRFSPERTETLALACLPLSSPFCYTHA